jgi:C1A family cysteine protease
MSWHKAGLVSKPLDQAQCGACWAVAATSMLESLAAIKLKQELV